MLFTNRNLVFNLVLLAICEEIQTARILAVFPTPSISHQVVFRGFTQELVKHGHDVVVITTDPITENIEDGKGNFTQIDLHDLSYMVKENIVQEAVPKNRSPLAQIFKITDMFSDLLEMQFKTKQFQNIIRNNNTRFDLLIVEAWVRPLLILSNVFRVPVIQISSFGSLLYNNEALGMPIHPILFPTFIHQKVYNLSLWDKIKEIHTFIWFKYIIVRSERVENAMLRRVFGHDIPTVAQLSQNIDLLLLNNHPMWAGNVPVPPNVIFVGGIYKSSVHKLPEDLSSFLNSSKNGVIYFSLGTNVKSSHIPPEIVKIFYNVFSELPYDVLWKWDGDKLPGLFQNIKTSKWFPQRDLLRHPKIKLFITQGGLQSTEEAISAGVPLIGIPFYGDQWYNSEKYVEFKIGLKLYIDSIMKENLREAILTVIKDESFRKNMATLRALMNDQPQCPLERAVWWTEHVLRHGGARHLRSPTANIGWMKYLEIEVVTIITIFILIVVSITIVIVKRLIRFAAFLFCNIKLKVE